MEDDNEIIYISVNNWCPTEDYPDIQPFIKWIEKDWLMDNNEWVKRTSVCVLITIIDMSFNYGITATRAWVEKHCPEIFEKQYSKFVYEPKGKKDIPCDRFGIKFLEYKPSNFGITFNKEIF